MKEIESNEKANFNSNTKCVSDFSGRLNPYEYIHMSN